MSWIIWSSDVPLHVINHSRFSDVIAFGEIFGVVETYFMPFYKGKAIKWSFLSTMQYHTPKSTIIMGYGIGIKSVHRRMALSNTLESKSLIFL